MNLTKQSYRDLPYEKLAQHREAHIVQLKYDGWWTRLEITKEGLFLYSTSDRLLASWPHRFGFEAVLFCEYMYGTQWSQCDTRLGKLFVFDCPRIGNTVLDNVPYDERYRAARTITAELQGNGFGAVELVTNYPADSRLEVWETMVKSGQYEGIVLRRSSDFLATPLYRCKATVTAEGYIRGVEAGEGKHAGRMGSVIVELANGAECRVGGGFSDEERQAIWDDLPSFIGRCIEIEARASFTSGSLRHPNFLRWRPDRDRRHTSTPPGE